MTSFSTVSGGPIISNITMLALSRRHSLGRVLNISLRMLLYSTPVNPLTFASPHHHKTKPQCNKNAPSTYKVPAHNGRKFLPVNGR